MLIIGANAASPSFGDQRVRCLSIYNYTCIIYIGSFGPGGPRTILVGECSASGSDPAEASKDVSMHTAHAGERATPCLQR